MAGLNGSVLLISLPAIFRGIGVDPLAPGEYGLPALVLLGYMLVTAALLVSRPNLRHVRPGKLYNRASRSSPSGSILSLRPGPGQLAAL